MNQDDYIKQQIQKAYDYCQDVKTNKIIVNKYIRQAVERFENDLNNGFEISENLISRFFYFLYYIRIEQKNKYVPFNPESWQCFYFLNLYGLVYQGTDTLKYNQSFLTVARKNGKSTIAVIQALFSLFYGYNRNSQNYVVSGSMKMANVCLEIARAICINSPALNKRVDNLQYYLRYFDKKDKHILKILPALSDKLNGLRPAFAIIDEMHVLEDAKLLDMIKGGQIGVHNPLVSIISTRGRNQEYYQGQLEEYYKQVLNGTIEAENEFALIYCLDSYEEIETPENWIKANPNLVNPDILKISDLLKLYNTSKVSSQNLVSFFIFNLNMWYDKGDVDYIQQEYIKQSFNNYLKLEQFAGYRAFLGVDLSNTKDITSISLLFPPQNDLQKFYFLNWNFKTNNIEKRVRKNGVDLTEYIESGELIEQNSNIIDYKEIIQLVKTIFNIVNIENVGYDQYNSTLFINEIVNDIGIKCTPVAQNAKILSEPTKYIEQLMIQNNIEFNNSINKWMFGNVVIYTDSNNNIKPMKNKQKDSIDGVISMINAMALYLQSIKSTELGSF